MRLFGFFSVAILGVIQLFACTGILVQAEDRSTVNGRTVEFGIELDMSLAVTPRNVTFYGKTPMGRGLHYISKYAAAGVYCFDDPVIMDGINEKGLVAAAFYFSGYASYTKVTKDNQAKALSPIDFPNWILTQFATIEEVKEALKSVVIAPTIIKNWGNTPPPMHYIVYDKSGRSIVIEPVEESLQVYENELGVITNSPTFDWQLTNLGNYTNLTPYNIGPNQLRGFKFPSFGQGSGMLGLPGDFTPPSRFVRAAFFSARTLPPKNSGDAVDKTFHILNQFDIPLGIVRQKDQGKISYDYTLLTSVKEPKTLRYFYRSYQDQSIQFVDLNQFDLNAKTIKMMKVGGDQQQYDVSSKLQQ
ncbi:MAG: choloylglycine hydrolase family protein [Chlamydiia bacterium]|nr:choloylglycine hydrolase family protein [Chlamydiia bacterium]